MSVSFLWHKQDEMIKVVKCRTNGWSQSCHVFLMLPLHSINAQASLRDEYEGVYNTLVEILPHRIYWGPYRLGWPLLPRSIKDIAAIYIAAHARKHFLLFFNLSIKFISFSLQSSALQTLKSNSTATEISRTVWTVTVDGDSNIN